LRRGYNVLAFDGPGQGAAIRQQKLVFRPDWEAVITPVINYALTREEIAPKKLVLFGYSLGAFLVARAAAFEHRPAAGSVVLSLRNLDDFEGRAEQS
jgi:alpha-beta hydrolase superfamily lysophospholipase